MYERFLHITGRYLVALFGSLGWIFRAALMEREDRDGRIVWELDTHSNKCEAQEHELEMVMLWIYNSNALVHGALSLCISHLAKDAA